MGILPVGYPVFLPCTNEEDSSLIEDQMSPVNMLPDPASATSDSGLQLHGLNNEEQNKVGAPLRQSPASSIPPVLPDLKEDTIRFDLCLYYFLWELDFWFNFALSQVLSGSNNLFFDIIRL